MTCEQGLTRTRRPEHLEGACYGPERHPRTLRLQPVGQPAHPGCGRQPRRRRLYPRNGEQFLLRPRHAGPHPERRVDLAGTLAGTLSHRFVRRRGFSQSAITGIAMGNREAERDPVYPSAHASAPERRPGLSHLERPTLFVSSLAADGSCGEPFQLSPRPGHHSATPTRWRSRRHGFSGILRREDTIGITAAAIL